VSGLVDRARAWLRAVVLRRRLEREMQEEMAEHLERATARFAARGLSPAEARRAAEREFGNVAWLQEQARDARGTAWLDALVGDLRFALRQYARRPATTLVMFVVLVVGMSITTLLFSFVHSYATQPPPGVELTPDMVRIRGSQSAGVHGRVARMVSADELAAYETLTTHFADVAGWTMGSAVLDAGAEPERRGIEARVTYVTESYFSVLGVRPQLGPGLATSSSADAALASTAVLSHATWERLFGSDPSIIGQSVALNGVSVTVVGVAPQRFLGVSGWGDYRIWMPLAARPLLHGDAPARFYAVARLQPGVTHRQASAAARVVSGAHADAAVAEPSVEVVPLRAASDDPMFRRDVKLLSAAVGLLAVLVLVVTCTNVSALLTGLATARRHEIAIRLSLGAARSRLIRQLLTESALLACAAAAGALLLAWGVLAVIQGTIADLPFEARLTGTALVFAFGVALMVGVLFGLSPALHATRLAVAGVLRDASANLVATRARLQRALVVAQIAFTQPLVVLLAAVLMLVLGEFQPAPRPAIAEHAIVVSVRVWMNASVATPEALAALEQKVDAATATLAERTGALPGVTAVVPTSGGATRRIGGYVAGDAPDGSVVDVVSLATHNVHPDYFDAMAIERVRGRTFAADEVVPDGSLPVPTVVDAALARVLWPGADPIGRELRPATDTAGAGRTLVVVGVVDDPAARRAVAGIDHFVFLPPDASLPPAGLLVRTAMPADALLPTVRALARSEVPDLAVEARTIADIVDEHERNFRLAASGVSAAGLAALLLAAIGLYAVVAFSVGQRTREIAVRLAIGGARPQIVQRFVADGLRLTAFGLVLGLPLSLLALRMLMATPDVPRVPLPPVTAIAALSVLLVAGAAAWIPARRAAAVDPAVTLRSE
jgi:predicted permease